jgi:hypothetical protein
MMGKGRKRQMSRRKGKCIIDSAYMLVWQGQSPELGIQIWVGGSILE